MRRKQFIMVIILTFGLLLLGMVAVTIIQEANIAAVTKDTLEVVDRINAEVADEEPEPGEITSESLGTYRITHYCACTKCTNGSGVTASGTVPEQGRTCAAEGLPIGTHVLIAETGEILTVEDRFGDPSKTHSIDVYVSDHEEALQRGVFTSEVFIIEF